jgi:hypothetical protein
MTTKMIQFGQFCLICIALCALFACSILGSGGDAPAKSASTRYAPPGSPFAETPSHGGADKAWQSEKTGNTIAYNSECTKETDPSFEVLKKKIFSGVDKLVIEKSESVSVDDRGGQQVTGTGLVDGVPVKLSVLTYKKNSCTYDLFYIAREKTFAVELSNYAEFVKGFRAP